MSGEIDNHMDESSPSEGIEFDEFLRSHSNGNNGILLNPTMILSTFASLLNSDSNESTTSSAVQYTTTMSSNTSDLLSTDDNLEGEFRICTEFLPTNHFYFQLANTFLFLSYLAPNGIYGILYLRVTLAIGSFFFSLWGYVILCALDTCIWNAVFFLINFVHACVIIYQLRPIKFPRDFENLYKEIFLPLRVSRLQFRRILDCMKEKQTLKPGETFAYERKTKVDKLSLVLSGRFMVSQDGKPLNFVTPNQFLDSPEWFGMSTDEYFQVTIIAVEDSSVLVWNRDKLKLTINGDAFLPAVFDHILGKDVVNKLMQVNETCLTNGAIPNADTASYVMEKPHYTGVQRKPDIEGICGNVNRHLQDGKVQDGLPCEIEPLLGSTGASDAVASINTDPRDASIC